jgi:hypothetical protein
MLEPSQTVEFARLDAAWRRCRREAHRLMLIELALTVVGVGTLVVVAICGIVEMTHAAVIAGAVALPLGLALAVTIALTLLGLAARARMSHEIVTLDLVRCEHARRCAAERVRAGADTHPYRMPSSAFPTCTTCHFVLRP